MDRSPYSTPLPFLCLRLVSPLLQNQSSCPSLHQDRSISLSRSTVILVISPPSFFPPRSESRHNASLQSSPACKTRHATPGRSRRDFNASRGVGSQREAATRITRRFHPAINDVRACTKCRKTYRRKWARTRCLPSLYIIAPRQTLFTPRFRADTRPLNSFFLSWGRCYNDSSRRRHVIVNAAEKNVRLKLSWLVLVGFCVAEKFLVRHIRLLLVATGTSTIYAVKVQGSRFARSERSEACLNHSSLPRSSFDTTRKNSSCDDLLWMYIEGSTA